jgi:hypothetical protein
MKPQLHVESRALFYAIDTARVIEKEKPELTGTQLALHALGTHILSLVHSPMKRLSPCLAGHSVPFLAAGVVMTYLRRVAQTQQ